MIQLANLMDGRSFPDSGNLLYQDMTRLLDVNKTVSIDLTGVISIPTMFLNASIGRAVDHYGVEKIKQSVVFYHITKGQAERLKEYFSRLS